jgi:hypothetical protein
VTRTIRLTSAYFARALAACGRAFSTVRAWLEPPLTADARPLEVREAIVERATQEARAPPDGRRVMPHNHLTVTVLVRTREDRASLGAVIDEIHKTIRGRLSELRCPVPAGFAVDVEYVRKPKPGWKTSCWIAGVSFGAWIAMQLLMRRPEVEGFISVAPPANLYDFTFLAPCPSSGLMVNGAKDRVVPTESVRGLVDRLKTQKGIVIDHQTVPDANHFFEERMEGLMEVIDGYLDKRLGKAGSKKKGAAA